MAVSAAFVPPGQDRTDGAAVITEPAFVGREPELAALTRALTGPPAVLVVEGEAGIGKSRLVRELLATPAGERHRCLTVTCPPFREPFTLGPVVDAIRQATGHIAGLRLSRLAGALRPLFPEWAEDLPALEALEDVRASRHRVFRALAEVLDRLNVGLVVLEDAHWADEATIEFLLFVSTQPTRPTSLVVTYRPQEIPADSLLPRLVSRAPAGTTLTRVNLTGLDANHTGELLSAMLGNEPVSRVFAELLCRRTGGIPFVVEQLVRLMYDRADLIHQDGQWKRHELHTIEVPPTIRDAILERVNRLPHHVRQVLHAAAVLGDPADETTLLHVADVTDGDDALSAALDSGLLVADHDTIAPRHALAATAIYESIQSGWRRAAHLRAAQALESGAGQPVERLAHHFRAAGEMRGWYRYAELAAARALETGDHTSAVAALRDLLAQADRADRSVLRLVDAVEVTSLRPPARYSELTDALRSMLTRLGAACEDSGRVRFVMARLLIIADRPEEGRAEMLAAIPYLADDAVIAGRAMLSLAIPIDPRSSVAEHLRWLRRASRLPRPADRSGRLAYQVNQASALLRLGLDEGWVAAGDLPDDAPTASERHTLASARVNMADAAMNWGWYDLAERHLAAAMALADPGQYPGVHDMLGSTRCHLNWFAGRWKGLAERARAIDADDDALRFGRLEARLVTGLLLRVGGADERAVQAFESILTERHSLPALALESAAALGRCWLDQGRVDDAVAVTEKPAAVLRGKGLWTWATELVPVRVDAMLAAGRATDAADLVTRFARGLRGRDLPAPRAALGWCRAALADHHGDENGAARRYARVAQAWRALPRPYYALLAEERRAGCLFASGHDHEGLSLLRQVAEGLSDLGALGDAGRVARRLRELGVSIRLDRRRAGYGDRLSPREEDVVRLVARGRTNREIGEELSRSPRTVSTQLYSAMRKLGVSSRTELAVRLLDGDWDDQHAD